MYDKFKLRINDSGYFIAEIKSFNGHCMSTSQLSAKEAVSDLLGQLNRLVSDVIKSSEEILGREVVE